MENDQSIKIKIKISAKNGEIMLILRREQFEWSFWPSTPLTQAIYGTGS